MMMKTLTRTVRANNLAVEDGGIMISLSVFEMNGADANFLHVWIQGDYPTYNPTPNTARFTFSEFHPILQKAVNEKQGKES